MTVDVSKQVGYVVLSGTDVQVTKSVGYVVLGSTGQQVSKTVGYVVVQSAVGNVRMPLISGEIFSGGNSNIRMPMVAAEVWTTGDSPNVRMPLASAEVTTGGEPGVRCPLIVIEVIQSVYEEKPVATDLLPTGNATNAPLSTPGLKGIQWPVRKKPRFRTDVNSSVNGKEVRTARMQYPIYEFELSFEWLDERDAENDLTTLMGFFMSQRGKQGSWLFQDRKDYIINGDTAGEGDDTETDFYITRTMGAFSEPIGQLDQSSLFTFTDSDVNTTDDEITVTGHGLATGYGPMRLTTTDTLPTGLAADTNYWLISVDDDTIQLATSYANAIAGTQVDITGTGTGTNTAANDIAVYLDGTEVDPADYTYTAPNMIVFDTAPTAGQVITMDCKFFFVCRFMDDIADFEEFMENLWALETLEFQSEIQ